MSNVEEFVYAKDIVDCYGCPLYETECKGTEISGYDGLPVDPPCTTWDANDKIYAGMLEERRIAYEKACADREKRLKRVQAKRAAETRKQYAYLDVKYQKFKAWLPTTHWNLIITSRRLDKVYMRARNKTKANYYFDLEKEKFCLIKGTTSLADDTLINRFENDFKEMYYGVRPKDRNFVKEQTDKIDALFRDCFGFIP